MSQFGALYDTASTILAVVRDAYAATADPTADPPVEAVDLPDRQYVVPGITAAYDCEQLTVTVLSVAVGVPGAAIGVPIANCSPMRFATYRLELVRCVPTVDERGDPPKATKLEESAQELLRDLSLLHGAVVAGKPRIAARPGEDPAIAGIGVPIAIGNATPVGSDGGYGGSRVDVDVPF